MIRCLSLTLVTVCLSLVPWHAAPAAPPVAQVRAARTDRYGDPLPPGALVRFGSGRLRVDGSIKAFAFWPDDTTLAACCSDGSVRLWDRATGRQKRRSQTSATSAYAATFVPDGKTVALIDNDRQSLLLWDTAAGKAANIVVLPKIAWEPRLAASPDGKLLAVAAESGVYLLDLPAGRKLRPLEGIKGEVRALVFAPDSTLLAVALLKPPVGLWNARTGKKVCDLNRPDDWFAESITFSLDGRTAAVWGGTRMVLSEVVTGKERARLRWPSHSSHMGMQFTQGGGLVIGELGGTLWFCDPATGKARFHRKTHWDNSPWPVLSHDGKVLAVGERQALGYQVIHLLDPATGKDLLPAPEGHRRTVSFVACSADGRTLLSGDEQEVRSWNAATGQPGQRLEAYISSAALSADRRLLASLWIVEVRLWDVTAGKKSRVLKYTGKDAIREVAFFPDGKSLLSVHNKCTPEEWREPRGKVEGQDGLHLWDLATGKEIQSFPTSTKDLYARLVVTPDGSTAIAGSVKGSVNRLGGGLKTYTESEGAGQLHVWNLRSGGEIRTLEGHKGAIRSLAVSADGRLVVSGSADKTCRVWELASGKAVFALPSQGTYEHVVALSPDGRLLATSGGPARPKGAVGPSPIYVRSLASGKPVLQLRGHDSDICSLSFSPDGLRLATGLRDGTALTWDVAAAHRASRVEAQRRSPKELDLLWTDLADADAAKARRALWKLVSGENAAVDLMRGRLKPAEGVDAKRLQQLLTDLDARRFAVREAAIRELDRLGELAEPALLALQKSKPSLELRRRIGELLVRIEKRELKPEQLRALRAVEALEHIGTAEAATVLRALAKGATEARLTREAMAALRRLAVASGPQRKDR